MADPKSSLDATSDLALPPDEAPEDSAARIAPAPDDAGPKDTLEPPAEAAAADATGAGDPDGSAAPDALGSDLGLGSVGAACASVDDCAGGICVDGICCSSTCSGLCEACNVAGHVGTCAPIPVGTDPADDCPQDPVSGCQRDGTCDGARACRLYPAGATCLPATCAGGTESSAATCNGQGACSPPTLRACAPYTCGTALCNSVCATAADCAPGKSCINHGCSSIAGLKLYWNFDEASGNAANDGSGSGLTGICSGSPGAGPTPSAVVPTLKADNPRSRAFSPGSQHEVRAKNLPAALMPETNITASAWFRAASSGETPLISGADGYQLYVSGTTVALLKRLRDGKYVDCTTEKSSGHFDGKWHHVAGTISAHGMRLFVDGVEACTSNNTAAIDYGTHHFVVGHDVEPNFGPSFEGNVDEVRVYDRALTAAEIAVLAGGGS